MPVVLKNPYRGTGLPGAAPPRPLAQAERVAELLARCPVHAVTPLRRADDLARSLGIATLWVKDESARMGLGSFKALGAAYAIACDAQSGLAAARTYVTASAGNHGLSVAAGAAAFGARAVIYLAETVPEAFAARLRATGAEVIRAGAQYEDAMEAAEHAAAATPGWFLLSDSTWPGYTDPALAIMEGYGHIATEIFDKIDAVPSHILLQAGVGGLAAAMAAHMRRVWGDAPLIWVVEPDAAPALAGSIRAGRAVAAEGPVSAMGRLDCKMPSLVALHALARDADAFLTITEAEAAHAVERLARQGHATTPSGAAGLAALLADPDAFGPDARILTILSEGSEDA